MTDMLTLGLSVALDPGAKQAPRSAPGVLYLDLEGGLGGSSRSLFYLVRAFETGFTNGAPVRPLVIGRAPKLEAEYRALGVPHQTIPEMPTFRPAERKNLIAYAFYLWEMRRFTALATQLGEAARRHEVAILHVNHESLALFGQRLARTLGLPWICHVRAQLRPGRFARFVYRTINDHAAHIIFIAEPNRQHFASLVGPRFAAEKTSVIHNIAPPPDRATPPHPAFLESGAALRVLSLSNFSPNRGVDRLIDVAAVLAGRGAGDITFYLCGRLANRRRLPFARNRYLERMQERVRAEGLQSMVHFPGHIDRPMAALNASHVLIKLTRQANPWGRDIIEAMQAGVPVISLGASSPFIEDGLNGFLDRDYEPERIADHLLRLRDDPNLREKLGAAGRERAQVLFDGPARARDVLALYKRVLA
jgi:glycosyltransferase involved in cell wall biosynthesis